MTKLQMLKLPALLPALLLALSGCQLVVDFDRSKLTDAAADSATDTGTVDAMADGATDAMTDGATDAMADGATDAMADAAADASMDGGSDAGTDAGTDAAMDAGTDAVVDTGVAMTCGNGVVEGTEACDDGNTLACGTCNATCTAAQPIAAATGSITVPVAASLVDGETFTIDDGANAASVFEFDTDASVGASSIAVDISAATTADQVRDSIVTAVNGVGAALEVTAVPSAAGVVSLVNNVGGISGNIALAETVADAGFVTTGMAGGVAADCAAATGCASADDCLSMSCTTMVCD